MKPVVLLVGRLPGVVGNVAKALEDMPIRWLGAHNRAEVIQQLDTEPGIACVVMGAGLDGVIAARRPDITIHLKDRASGPDGLLSFTQRVVEAMVLGERV